MSLTMANEGNMRIEALEHQLMRSWLEGDRKLMKKLLSSRFRLVVGAKAPVLLDRKSMVEAAGAGWRIHGYRFGNSVYSRTIGPSAVFAARWSSGPRSTGWTCRELVDGRLLAPVGESRSAGSLPIASLRGWMIAARSPTQCAGSSSGARKRDAVQSPAS
jgi:hypothetical protein